MADEPKEKPTAAQTAGEGKTEDVVKLQKKLAGVEDENTRLKARGKEYEDLVADLKAMPGRAKDKSVLDELNLFREGRAKPGAAGAPAAPPPPKNFLDEVHDHIFE